MTDQQLKEAVLTAHANLTEAISQARAAGITVNLWINGTGPTKTGPSQVGLDFGPNQG